MNKKSLKLILFIFSLNLLIAEEERDNNNASKNFFDFINKANVLYSFAISSYSLYYLYNVYKENKIKKNLKEVLDEEKLKINYLTELPSNKSFSIKDSLEDRNNSKNYYQKFTIIYKDKSEEFEKILGIGSGIDFLIVYGNPYCGKTVFIEKCFSDISLKENKILPIKITKNSLKAFENYINFLDVEKNTNANKQDPNPNSDKKNELEVFLSELYSFKLNSKNEENLFVFYFDLREFLPILKNNDQDSINEFNKEFFESVSSINSLLKVMNWLREEKKFKIKFVIEVDFAESFNLIKNILSKNEEVVFKSVIHLENPSKKDLFDFYKNYLLNNSVFISDQKIKRLVSFSRDFSLQKSINFIELICKKIVLNNFFDVDENFITDFLKFFKNESKFEKFIESKITKNDFAENPYFNKYEKADVINLKFDDVAGNFFAKEALKDFVDYLKNPEKYLNFGISIEKGILLRGPSGCGKTLLGKALAGEANVPFFYVSASDFEKIYVGTGPENIKRLFQFAKANAPSIIFIDEIDALGGNRNSNLNKNSDTLNQFLVELGGFEDDDLPVLVIGSTNAKIKDLDPALIRPGRLGKIIECINPLLAERLDLAAIATKNKFLDEKLTLEYIAKKTNDFSGAEIVELLNSAAGIALKKNKCSIDIDDFNEAFERMILGFTNPNLSIKEKIYYETAIHEIGHTLCMIFNKFYSRKFDSVSILPRNFTLGVTHSVNEDDFLSPTKEDLEGLIICSFGGIVAEKISLNTSSAGVSSDLEKTKRIASSMVLNLGMKGVHLTGRKEEDDDVKKAISEILEDCYQKAFEIINNKKELLEILAKKLVAEKVLYANDIKEICKENGYEEGIINI